MKNENFDQRSAVWAVDPFEEKADPHPFEIKNLMGWMAQLKINLLPVYILNLATSPHPLVDQCKANEKKLQEVEVAMKLYLKKIGVENALSPKVFINYDNDKMGPVEDLLRISDEAHAQMIIISSRGRKGLDRFIFGSFAESLLLKSKIPLYFLTHRIAELGHLPSAQILFPTDLSLQSESAYERMLKMAKLSSLEIILYYGISMTSPLVGGDGLIYVPDNLFELQELEATITAKRWVEKANLLGVHVKLVIVDLGFNANIASAIMKVARDHGVRFIAMASSSGRAESLFFGSVARDVFRMNLFPVWICGPLTSRPQ